MKKREYTSPEQKREIMIAAGLMPLTDFEHKDKPWKSKCLKCGKIVEPRFGSIRNGQGGCKYCAGVYLDEEDALSALHAAGFSALEPYRGTQLPWKSQCDKCGKVSSPTLSNIRTLNSGCKFCAAKTKAEKSKLTLDEIVSTLNSANLEPIGTISYENNKVPIALRCLVCNYIIRQSLNSIRNGAGCAYCSQKRVDPNVAVDLMITQGVKPLEPYKSSSAPWKCICLSCEREITPTYSSVKGGHSGCAYCSGKRIDLLDAAKVMKSNKLLPLEPYPGAGIPWKSQCLVCGRQASPRLSNLKSGYGGCLNCAGKFVDPEDAVKLMLDAKLKPLEPYQGRHSPWKSLCLSCQRQVSPTYGSVSRGSGCRFCSEIGIDYTSPGYVYLITHFGMMSHKVGIANTKPRKKYYDRVQQHIAKGWLLVSRHEFESAEIAHNVEQGFLKWVREDLGLGVYLSQDEMPQGGYTETFSGDDDVRSFAKKLNELANLSSQYVQQPE